MPVDVDPAEAPAFWAFLADTAYDPLLLAGEDGLILMANRAARMLFLGVDEHNDDLPDEPDPLPSKADIVGHHIADLIDSPELEDMIYCVFSSEEDCPETQFPIRGRFFRARCTRVQHSSGRCMAVALNDITQALRLNRARRDMVANISHELRTPITGIRLLSETLERQKLGKKQRAKVIRKIGRELDTLQRIVEGMRDLSMIESGQSIMRLVEVPLLPMISEALEALDEYIGRRKLKLNIDVPAEYYILADSGQISRVLANLIHNAVKFSPKNGRINISAQATAEDDFIVLRIADSGPGIAPEERDRIFERFYQIDTARSSGGRGSGLGLAIAKHIVSAHGGKVWVENSNLGGACLCFTVPLANAPAPVGEGRPNGS